MSRDISHKTDTMNSRSLQIIIEHNNNLQVTQCEAKMVAVR